MNHDEFTLSCYSAKQKSTMKNRQHARKNGAGKRILEGGWDGPSPLSKVQAMVKHGGEHVPLAILLVEVSTPT